MADPEPPVGLPAVEYVELKNAGSVAVSLEGWIFRDRSTEAQLRSFQLGPGEHLILCPAGSMEEFVSYGNVMELQPWPRLNNTDDDLELVSETGITEERISYERSWYRSTSRDDGGYSLERIGTGNWCEERLNWIASENKLGGTPGMENSISTGDIRPPELQNAFATSERSILLTFNEAISTAVPDMIQVKFDPALGIDSLSRVESHQLLISLRENLSKRVRYRIILNKLADCSGNFSSGEQQTVFVLPEPADSMDIVINEVLFNPFEGGSDFVELHNRSEKYINIRDWNIGNFEDSLTQFRTITKSNFLLSPGDFLVLTENTDKVKDYYPSSGSALFLLTDLPGLPNSEGSVGISTRDSHLVDAMKYREDFHYSLLRDLNGVSLERLDAWADSFDENNWKSAAETAGFATPGTLNSQNPGAVVTDLPVIVEPRIIFPNNDGQSDYCMLSYHFNKPGYVATIRIFDLIGNKIRELANNMLLGTTGFFTWDGTDWRGRRVKAGHYLIHFEVYHTDGSSSSWLTAIVVATHF